MRTSRLNDHARAAFTSPFMSSSVTYEGSVIGVQSGNNGVPGADKLIHTVALEALALVVFSRGIEEIAADGTVNPRPSFKHHFPFPLRYSRVWIVR